MHMLTNDHRKVFIIWLLIGTYICYSVVAVTQILKDPPSLTQAPVEKQEDPLTVYSEREDCDQVLTPTPLQTISLTSPNKFIYSRSLEA